MTRLLIVGLAATSTTTARILIGRTGGRGTFEPLVSRLEGRGHKVTEDAASPVGPRGSLEGLDGVDFVLLVVRENDDAGSRGPIRPFQRIARDAGLLQAKMGADRVALLVEDTVTGLTSDLDVGVIRFAKASPEGAFDKISDRLAQVTPKPELGIHNRLSRAERSKIAHSMAPLLVAIALVFLVAFIGALLIVFWSRLGGGDNSDDGQATAQLIDVTEALRSGSGAAGRSAVGSIVAGEDTGGGPSPAGPSAGFAEANQLLPATCEVSLAKGEDIPDEIPCAGAGVLVRVGSPGPWHNEVRLVALSEGVVSEVIYESAGSLTIESGVAVLDPEAAAYGLESLSVTFGAPGQHVHLRDGTGDDAREVTLTLRLDR